jgi:hypothetical protein
MGAFKVDIWVVVRVGDVGVLEGVAGWVAAHPTNPKAIKNKPKYAIFIVSSYSNAERTLYNESSVILSGWAGFLFR